MEKVFWGVGDHSLFTGVLFRYLEFNTSIAFRMFPFLNSEYEFLVLNIANESILLRDSSVQCYFLIIYSILGWTR